ncbi:MAG: DUF2442 domain-containing protein [Deltaproteobacteria bacterium]|nr:DUF2442 domain-containing protein [Deltaproteobacteria bacterium]
MLQDIVEVKVLDGYRLHLRFEDGVEGVVDIADLVRFEGVFSQLRDRRAFEKVRVHPELGTVVWPGGADLDPDVLYAEVTSKPIVVAQPAVARGESA